MRSRRAGAIKSIFNNPVLIGTLTVLVVIVAVFLSYTAQNGLPFIPTYAVNVQVADGGELNKNADVRIGGARVGQVLAVVPEPASKQWPHPYAKLELQLQKSLQPLPANTKYQVRLASILGGQYVELFPGKKSAGVGTVPDGGTLALNTNNAKNHNVPYIDMSQAFDVFGPKTRDGIRSVTRVLGDSFSGRGAEINQGIYSLDHLISPVQNVLRLLSSPSTNLRGFLSNLASSTSVIAPETSNLFNLLQNGATTAGALNTPALGQTFDTLPSVEDSGSSALNNSRPVLNELAGITQELKPAAAVLPGTAQRLDTVLNTAGPTLQLLTPVSNTVNGALAATKNLANDPSATQAFKNLGSTDLGTAGSSAFLGLGAIFNTVKDAQVSCNVVGTWSRNFAGIISEGNAQGNWLRMMPVVNTSDLLQSNQTSPDLHMNTNPQETGGQCQDGNESYAPGTSIGSPGGTAGHTANTAPPSGTYGLGKKAGLVP
ncbi:MAG: MCE family protein [Solirubrobacterales bacterium]|nr:MCE family protein [Solirubrobacterales bacterium]